VLLTAPSLRSDTPPTFDAVQRRCAGEAKWGLGRKKIMTVFIFDFLIAVAVGIAAAAIMAFLPINVVIGWFKKT
jgi:hypothetical protein